MDITITPALLSGRVAAPPSKSVGHRLIISAALSRRKSVISNISRSNDIEATINAMVALGAKIDVSGDKATVFGIETPSKEAEIDCCESGSTLRFIIPIAAALGVRTRFLGKGKLPTRPITPYLRELTKGGITFDYNGSMPFSISGQLKSGDYELEGDISSQFVTGLIFALTMTDGKSRIKMISPLQSKPYVDITIDCLKKFGADITELCDGWEIKGKRLVSSDQIIEGDYSQAAFFYVANALGSDIEIEGLDPLSVQGDRKIAEICRESVNGNGKDKIISPFSLDCSDIPDLVPILTVLASFADGKSELTNIRRLRIKESDRIAAISECLNSVGGRVKAYDDKLVIEGVKNLSGGTVDSYNDHRIAMSMAIAAIKCTDTLKITNAECVKKSYPDFFEVYNKLNGKAV